MAKQKFYAYFIPLSASFKTSKQGVTDNWAECEPKVKGIAGARFRSFGNLEDAEVWLRSGADYAKIKDYPLGIYFDAGTGRGNGVEVSVVNEKKENLLPAVLKKSKINKFGKELLPREFSNNYGELLALSYALKIALKGGVKNIYGDSALVVNYWSKGMVRKERTAETIKLAKKVTVLRKKFEAGGGRITLISGGMNPADLGFH